MRNWQNGRKSSISYDREFGRNYDGNLALYTRPYATPVINTPTPITWLGSGYTSPMNG
jgi:hypothetical protein